MKWSEYDYRVRNMIKVAMFWLIVGMILSPIHTRVSDLAGCLMMMFLGVAIGLNYGLDKKVQT